MYIKQGQRPALVRLCRRVPLWISTGIRGAEGDDTGSGGDGTGSDGGTGGTEPTAREKALQEEKDRHFANAKKAKEDLAAATTTLAEVQARLKELEDKDKSESEKAKADAQAALAAKEKADADLIAAQKKNDELQIQIAFLASNKFTWHDAGVALQLVNGFGEIEVKDGEVKGLDKAIDKMAKDKPFLVKAGGDDAGTGAGGTGGQPNGASTRSGQDGITQDQKVALATKYNIPR